MAQRVLIASTNDDERLMYQDFFSFQGFAVWSAADLDTVIEGVQDAPFALAIICARLRGGGPEAVRRIRHANAPQDTRVIVLVSGATDAAMAEAEAAGADAILLRPVLPDVLLAHATR